MAKKFQNLIGFPVKATTDSGLTIRRRGLYTTGLPLLFTVGGIPVGPFVTAAALNAACINNQVPQFTTAPMDIYLSNTGSDTTGNGTALLPFATFDKAFSVIPKFLRHKVRVIPAAGVYVEFPETNNFWIDAAGGSLVIDASHLPQTEIFSDLAVDSFFGGIPAGPSGNPSANKISVAVPTFTADTMAPYFVRFSTGAAAGKYLPIWKNTTTDLWIGPDFDGIIPGDLFDIVSPPVIISQGIGKRIDFDFHCPPDFTGKMPPVFGVASIVWSFRNPLESPARHISISNCNAAWPNTVYFRADDPAPKETMHLNNCNLNYVPVTAGFFQNPVFDDYFYNWFTVANGGAGIPAASNSIIYMEGSNLGNCMHRGSFWATGSIPQDFYAVLCWAIGNQNTAEVLLSLVFLDDPISTEFCLGFKSSKITIIEAYINACEGAFDLRDQCAVRCDWLLMYPAAIRSTHAIRAYNGVSMRITEANFNLTGTSITGAVIFQMGDQSEYAALAAAGSTLTDTTDCFIHSV